MKTKGVWGIFLLFTSFPPFSMGPMTRKAISLLSSGAIALQMFGASSTAFAAPAVPTTGFEGLISQQLHRDIEWESVSGDLLEDGVLLIGHTIEQPGVARFRIECRISYPPLTISCTLSFD